MASARKIANQGEVVSSSDATQPTPSSTSNERRGANRRSSAIPQSIQNYIDQGKAAAAAAEKQIDEIKDKLQADKKDQSKAQTNTSSASSNYSAPNGQTTGALGQSGTSNLPVISQANTMVTTEKMETKDVLAEAGKGMLTVLGVAAVATAVVLVLTGVAQNYARKKRYKVGNSAFWTWLAKVPSLAHPRPFFYKIGQYNGTYQGDMNCGDVYNELSLLPCIKTETDDIVPLDDWGGWLALSIKHGEANDLITGYEPSSRSIQVVDKDFVVRWYKIPELSEVAGVLWLTENQ